VLFGAVLFGAVLTAEGGPVELGEGSIVMENAGPLAPP
jgi:hypothetical protein